MTTTTRRYIERAATPVRVNREAGIIYGVKLLGKHSRNHRSYTERAMQDAVPLYEGKKVYLNHPQSDKLSEDRPFQDWVGVLRNPRYEHSGIFADVALRTKGAHYEELVEAAEKFHGCFGMSHVADGESRMERGQEIIESIKEVFSVDIVTDPATTAGFFESVGDGMADIRDDDGDDYGFPRDKRLAIKHIFDRALRISAVSQDLDLVETISEAVDVIDNFDSLVAEHQAAALRLTTKKADADPVSESHHVDGNRYSLESFGCPPPIRFID